MSKKINIGLPEELHKQAKVVAVLTNTRLNDFFSKAIEAALKRDMGQLKNYVTKGPLKAPSKGAYYFTKKRKEAIKE